MKAKCRMPLYMAGRVITAMAIGSVAATARSRRLARCDIARSRRAAAMKANTVPANVSARKTSGICSTSKLGRYVRGMSGTGMSAPANNSFHGFSKNTEKYSSERSGLSGSTTAHGHTRPMTR